MTVGSRARARGSTFRARLTAFHAFHPGGGGDADDAHRVDNSERCRTDSSVGSAPRRDRPGSCGYVSCIPPVGAALPRVPSQADTDHRQPDGRNEECAEQPEGVTPRKWIVTGSQRHEPAMQILKAACQQRAHEDAGKCEGP